MLKFFVITIFIFINKILNEDVYNFENLWKFTTDNIKKSESNYFLVDPNNIFNENDKNSITQMQKEFLDKNNVYSYIFVVEKLQENSNDFINKLKDDLFSNIKTSYNDKEKNSIIFIFSIKDEKCFIKSGEEITKIINLEDFSFDNNDQYLKEKNYNLYFKKYLHDFKFYLENPVQKEKKEENNNNNSNNNNNNNSNNNNNNNNSNNNNNNENDDSKQNENEENKNNENSNQKENENTKPEINNEENINNEKNRENSKNDFDYDDDEKEKKGIGFFGKFLIFCVIVGLFYFGYYYYYKRKKKVGILNFNYDNFNRMNNNSGQELSNNEYAYYK